MIRPMGFWLVLLVTVGGSVLYTNLQARQLETELAEVKAETVKERARIRVLTAEWYSLTTPERLEKLSQRHLELQNMAPTQIALANDVPERLVSAEESAPVALAEASDVKPAQNTQAPPKPKAETRLAAIKPVAKSAPVREPARAVAAKPKPAPKDDMIATLIERENMPGMLHASYWNNR